MTVEDCRTILKVHICAAESVGKTETALSLLEVLAQIDAQAAVERATGDSVSQFPLISPRFVGGAGNGQIEAPYGRL